MPKEANEQRIIRLEGTCDALQYNLENLAKQLAIPTQIETNTAVEDGLLELVNALKEGIN